MEPVKFREMEIGGTFKLSTNNVFTYKKTGDKSFREILPHRDPIDKIVSNIFPTNNPIGNHPTIQQTFMFYPPEISNNMPLMGFEPYNVNY